MSGDLKAVFGQAKVEDNAEGEENTGWDQVEEEEEEEEGKEEESAQALPLLPADPGGKQEESSGFKFSFFGDDTDTGSAETGEAAVNQTLMFDTSSPSGSSNRPLRQQSTKWKASRRQRCPGNKTHVSMTAAQKKMMMMMVMKSQRKRRSKATVFLKPSSKKYQLLILS